MTKNIRNKMTINWVHPFTAILAGPTSCGKSSFIKEFLTNVNVMVDTKLYEILYCLPDDQPIDRFFMKFRVIRGVPDQQLFKDLKPRLVIIDDLMRETNSDVVDLFTKGSHHFNSSVMYVTQNIFNQGKGRRTMSLNAHYIVAFKNPRDRVQIQTLARQVSPDNTRYIQEAYKDATDRPYGYLLFDLKQTTPDLHRYRTNIFPSDKPSNVVYIPKNS